MIDILFIHPNASQIVYQDLGKSDACIEPPIWANMLTNICFKRGYRAELLDCEAEGLSYEDAAKRIKDIRPTWACFVVYGQQPSASSQNMEGAVGTAEELKKISNIRTLFVGPHIAALPEETLLKHDCVDYVCQNESVYTILNLLKAKTLDDKLKVDGLGYKIAVANNKVVSHLNQINKIVPQNKLEQDLPGQDFSLYDFSKYRTAGWHAFHNNGEKVPFASVYTSLGCPFSCSFCMINIINKESSDQKCSSDCSRFRFWSPEFTIKQLDELAHLGIRNLKIADELFVLRESHFKRLCELIIERKYDFNIWCYARIDTCKKKYLDLLKRAGVNQIGIGIEAGNKKVRKDVVKGGFQDVKIKEIVNDIHNAGIEVGANYIFGLPEDTVETMQETYDLSVDLDTTMVNYYCAVAYPGSKLYLQAKEQGLKLPDCYAGYSQHSYYTQNLPSKYLSAETILRFRDNAWINYHSRAQFLSKIKDRFGEKSYQTLVDSLKIKLRRKILGD